MRFSNHWIWILNSSLTKFSTLSMISSLNFSISSSSKYQTHFTFLLSIFLIKFLPIASWFLLQGSIYQAQHRRRCPKVSTSQSGFYSNCFIRAFCDGNCLLTFLLIVFSGRVLIAFCKMFNLIWIESLLFGKNTAVFTVFHSPKGFICQILSLYVLI